MKYEGKERFQYKPFYIKLLRTLRHYPKIPFRVIYQWMWYQFHPKVKRHDDLSFKTIWDIEVGEAQFRMGWYYNWSEIKNKV